MSLLTPPNGGLIVRLSYFQNVIEEAATSKVMSEDGGYLRRRVGSLEKERLEEVGPLRIVLARRASMGGLTDMR